jgi:predicted site-specific integrase-resolvase
MAEKATMPQNAKTILDGYLTEDQQALKLGVTVRTLRKWRASGEGPAFVKAGKRVLYTDESAAAWLKAREQKPVRSAENRAV